MPTGLGSRPTSSCSHPREGIRVARGSAVPAGDGGRLLDPGRQLLLLELVVLVDVEVAHFLLLGLAGGERTQRRAAEESHLDVLREAMEAEEPGRLSVWVLDAIEGRVPLHGLAHAGYGAHDEGVQAAPD